MPDREEVQSKKSNKTSNAQNSPSEPHSRVELLAELIIQLLPMGVVVFDPDLKIIEANPQAARLVELGDYIDQSLAKGTNNPGMPGPDWTGQLKSVVSTGKTRGFERVSYALNGKTKLLQIVCKPLKKASTQKILGAAAIIEDITEKVNTQTRLANIEKLATVGKLASKVAHELNNPLDGILRYTNLTIRIIEQRNLKKAKEYLNQCRQGVMRMVQIVSELLEFSRSTYSPSEFAKVEHIIEDAIKTMGTRAEDANVQILRNYAPGIPQIRNDNLFQVFCNLIKNALDAMPDGGEITISTRLTADNTVVVEFRDTGMGFAPEHAKAIFEPFFTTKDKGKGTGLGLAICKDIIERYHGRITAENAAQGGGIFSVYLPVENENL